MSTAVKHLSNDQGTDLTVTMEVVSQDVEANTSTVAWSITGTIVMSVLFPEPEDVS